MDNTVSPALADFLAHSLELESEAQARYEELAEAMAAHHNLPVANFFRRMAAESERHQQEVAELAAGVALPELHAWDFDWPDAEPPETVSYEALHYRMNLHQAMQLALANEYSAQRYYRRFADTSDDAPTAALAARFADEEQGHAEELERLLAALPAEASEARDDDDDPHMPE
jgi:rubrerythrin